MSTKIRDKVIEINEPSGDTPIRFGVEREEGDLLVWARTQTHAHEIADQWERDNAAEPRPHEAIVKTVSDGQSFPRRTTIEETDPRAFAFELAKEIETQIRSIACGQPVETEVTLHIVKPD